MARTISGQEVLINNTNKGDNRIKEYFQRLNFTTNNKDDNFGTTTVYSYNLQNGEPFVFQNGINIEFN